MAPNSLTDGRSGRCGVGWACGERGRSQTAPGQGGEMQMSGGRQPCVACRYQLLRVDAHMLPGSHPACVTHLNALPHILPHTP